MLLLEHSSISGRKKGNRWTRRQEERGEKGYHDNLTYIVEMLTEQNLPTQVVLSSCIKKLVSQEQT